MAMGIAILALAHLTPLNIARAQTTTTMATAAIPLRTGSIARAEVLALSEKVADYQLVTMAAGYYPANASSDTPDPRGWVQAALFIGLSDLAEHSDKPRFQQVIFSRAEANKWELGKRLYHADDHAIGQAYLWAARHGAGDAVLKNMRSSFDKILANQSEVSLQFQKDPGVNCQVRWCWCDALFMAPAAWLEMSKVTGDERYAIFAKKEFWATTDYLYDKSEQLYFRDSRFFDQRGPKGEKIFWSRGNGWVFGGLARMIPLLSPADPDRPKLVALFKDMAARLKAIQKPDGYWAPSLLSDPATALPESSGTGFYVYGLAWGVKAGILDRANYEPAIRRGWNALTQAVHPSGKLGWVQPVSDRPDTGNFEDTQFYGVGAFLLAATAVADLNLKPAP